MKERGRKEESREKQAELRATENEKRVENGITEIRNGANLRVCSNTDLKRRVFSENADSL